MPYFEIKTNKKLAETKQSVLLAKMSDLVKEELGKPEKFIMTSITGDVPMLMDRSKESIAFVQFKSIGLPDTKKLSSAICKLINQEMDISVDRIYIEFTDEPRSMFGWNGSTFEK